MLPTTVRFAGTLPKRGSTTSECEDSVCVSVAPDGTLRVAVADGASESLFSGLWAALLTEAWTGITYEAAFADAVTKAAAQWEAFVKTQALPWFAAPKRARGAHGAVISVAVSLTGEWTATAVGDACVFQIREERLITAFPIEATPTFPPYPF